MLSFACDFPECLAKSLPIRGDCELCRRHLCLAHLFARDHICGHPSYDRNEGVLAARAENARMQAIIEALGILETALKLRPGHTIRPASLQLKDLPGGRFNVHVPIEYDDGVKWIARIRRQGVNTLHPSLAPSYIKAEVDVMEWLHLHGFDQVPQVTSPIYTHGAAEFFFMAMMSGSPFPIDIQNLTLTPEMRNTIWDYARFNIRRSEHPLRLVGSLHYDRAAGTFSVGPNISHFVDDPAQLPGPWRTAAEKYEYRFNHILGAIQDGSIYPHRREMAFLIYSWMKEVVLVYPPYMVEGPTFVVHEDSNGGHILVDEEGRITGLLDWERTSVSILCEAFSTPEAFEDSSLFYRGSNDLSFAEMELVRAYRELGRPDLADCIVSGKPFQWLSMIVGNDLERSSYRYVRALGESLGLEMEESVEEFLAVQRRRYGHELARIEGIGEADRLA